MACGLFAAVSLTAGDADGGQGADKMVGMEEGEKKWSEQWFKKFVLNGFLITAVCKKAGHVTETKKLDLKTFESYLSQFWVNQ